MSPAYLLDTHYMLWFDLAPAKLSEIALTRMQDRKNGMLVSSISVLEIAIKYRLVKLR